MPDNKAIAQAIKNLRKDRNLTQAQLAAALEIAPTSVYRWEAETSAPDLGMVLNLWHFAVLFGSGTAATFADILITGSPILKPLVAGARAEAQRSLEDWAGTLPEDHQNLVAGLIHFLKEGDDKTTEKILRVLLEPWIIPTSRIVLQLGLERTLTESIQEGPRRGKRKQPTKKSPK
jgi:transcriptional regulator with XRE-family HTH domain